MFLGFPLSLFGVIFVFGSYSGPFFYGFWMQQIQVLVGAGGRFSLVFLYEKSFFWDDFTAFNRVFLVLLVW